MEPLTPETKSVQPEKADFKHRFLTSTGNFLVEDNASYRLEADHKRRLIVLTVKKNWDHYSQVPTLDTHLRNVVAAMTSEFGILIDVSGLTPDSDGTIIAPAIPSRGYIFDAGLVKVADVIPYNCDELVHGAHAFSVNSVKMRPFTTRFHAENWLTAE